MGIAALAGGAGLICWNGGIGVFAIDLKLGRVIKIATLSDVSFVIPYKSFYTPGIKLMPCFIYLVTTEVWIMIYVFPHAQWRIHRGLGAPAPYGLQPPLKQEELEEDTTTE